MKRTVALLAAAVLVGTVFVILPWGYISTEAADDEDLDARVRAFLENHRRTWREMNVQMTDGQLLHDIIVEKGYQNALEIGTSTGHSAIWIAWALSKTDGKLITIEIDERRYREALANFEEAGVSDFIDARMADAHVLVRELDGPFDFIFCDADKEWYRQYFIDLYPKLSPGGCYVAHNVSDRGWRSRGTRGTGEFYSYIIDLPDMDTTVDNSGGGMSISYKASKKD